MRLPDMSFETKVAEIEADMAVLLKNRAGDVRAIYAVSQRYGALEMKNKQKELEDRILREAPASTQAEAVLVNRYQDFLSLSKLEELRDPIKKAELIKMLRELIKYPHYGQEWRLGGIYTQLFFLIKDEAGTTDAEMLDVVKSMVKLAKENPHVVYAEGAIALAQRKKYFREAEKIARDGIAAERKSLADEFGPYATEAQLKALRRNTARLQDALGRVFFYEGRLDDAEKELLRAHTGDPESATNHYHVGQLYEARKALDKAEEFYIKGIRLQHPGENPNEKALKDLYLARKGKLDGYEEYLAGIREKESVARKQRVLAERINEPQPLGPFSLKTLDGARLSSDGLKGKIAVVNFWSIRCEWCVEEMQEFQKLHEQYKNDPDVLILTISTDNGVDLEAARNYMKVNTYDFNVLLDDGYAGKMGVSDFPTTWFLDQAGRKAYQKVGWTEKLAEEFSWRIESLRTPEAIRKQVGARN